MKELEAVQTLGMFTPYIWGEFVGEIHTTLLRQAAGFGFRVVLVRTGSWHRDYQSPLAIEACDAWLDLLDCVLPPLADRILAGGRPYVSVAHRPTTEGASSVRCDNASGVVQILEHLVAAGHRRIAFLGEPGNSDMAEREEGFRRFLGEKGWLDPNLLRHSSSASIADGWQMAQDLHRKGDPFTAVVAATDLLALGTLQHFQEVGLRVPQDVAVSGFDNILPSQDGPVPLTSVDQSIKEMVGLALAEVRRRLDDPAAPPRHLKVAPVLHPRPSTGGQATSVPPTSVPAELDREVGDSLVLDGELNHFLSAGFQAGGVQALLVALGRRGRTASLYQVVDQLCLALPEKRPTVPLTRFRSDLLAAPSRTEDLLVIVPCLDGPHLGYVFAFTVPAQQVSHQALLALAAHEWEMAALAIERATIEKRLEHEVRERTRRLEETLKRLESAQADLVRGEKLAVIGQMAAKVSHEINSPLAVILSSGGHIRESLEAMTKGLISPVRDMDAATYQAFLPRLWEVLAHGASKDHRSQRTLARSLKAELAPLELDHGAEVVGLLADLGVLTPLPDWLPLLRQPDCRPLLRLMLRITEVHNSAALLNDAGLKVSAFVDALSLLPDPTTTPYRDPRPSS